MRKLLFIALICIFSLMAKAQQPIQFSQISNLDMMIANIFGVQCDGVSNVQLMAVPLQIGRFENGQTIGLNSGIVLSTGIVTGTSEPSGNFYSTGLGSAGDADIAMFGSAAGQVPTNYDACRIEFDFTPSVSDTIRFTYVLASEEYPEFSNSSFTDRFLFLVSENSGPYSNIAFLPGTTIPVEINSVNQLINPQYFNDNLSGPSSAFFVFDGFTVPFEAKFYAQVGVNYHIKLVLADVSDAYFDSAIFLDEQESYNDINGNLTVNGAPAEGIIEVFNFVGDTLLAQPVQSLVVTNGTYLADSLQTGMYHIRFTPDPLLFPGVAPLYYTAGDTWSTADAIGLPCFLNSGNINSNTLNVLSGSGIIAGNIVIDTSFLKSPVQGFEGALVKLFSSTNEVIAFEYSDINGDFEFQNIPTGNYTIKLDVPYIPQLNEHQITITGNQIILGADFSVLLDGITAVDNLTLGVIEQTLTTVELFPNPAKEKLLIKNDSGNNLEVKINAINGQLIKEINISNGINEIHTGELEDGIYFVQIGTNDLRKLIIKK